MKNKKKVIIISIISAALIAVTIIIALFSGCSKNTSTPDEATADTATSDTAATIDTTTLNIEAQAITDNGLSIDKDGNVIDKDGKKVEPSEDGKVKIKTDDGKTVEVSADDIKKSDSKNSSDNNSSSSSSSKNNKLNASKNNNSGSSSGSSSSKSDTPKQDNNGKTYHEAVYKTVHHEAETEQVWVVDEAAYSYEEPVYEAQNRTICNTCGADITDNSLSHRKAHLLNGENSSYHIESKQVQSGTKTVDVAEQGHYETKTIKEAYDEKVLVKEAGWY